MKHCAFLMLCAFVMSSCSKDDETETFKNRCVINGEEVAISYGIFDERTFEENNATEISMLFLDKSVTTTPTTEDNLDELMDKGILMFEFVTKSYNGTYHIDSNNIQGCEDEFIISIKDKYSFEYTEGSLHIFNNSTDNDSSEDLYLLEGSKFDFQKTGDITTIMIDILISNGDRFELSWKGSVIKIPLEFS